MVRDVRLAVTLLDMLIKIKKGEVAFMAATDFTDSDKLEFILRWTTVTRKLKESGYNLGKIRIKRKKED